MSPNQILKMTNALSKGTLPSHLGSVFRKFGVRITYATGRAEVQAAAEAGKTVVVLKTVKGQESESYNHWVILERLNYKSQSVTVSDPQTGREYTSTSDFWRSVPNDRVAGIVITE